MSHAIGDYTVTLHDPREDSDDEVAERCAFNNRVAAEAWPEDPPIPLAQFLANQRAAPQRLQRTQARARAADGSLVGIAGSTFDADFNDNPDMGWIGLEVDPAHRRRGIGSALLRALLDTLEQWGRTRVLSETVDRVPGGAAFATAVGAVSQQDSHVNHLPVAKIDRALMEQWVAAGPGRAPGYELLTWDGPVPEEHMDRWVEVLQFVNTVPRDGVEQNDVVITDARVRERDAQMAAVGIEVWVLVARHVATGVFAGFHDVWWNPSDPENIAIGATIVDPDHRGHALGKWLKAAMTLRILHQRPAVTSIRTDNADSNDAMLGINQAMGYEPLAATTTWETDLQALTARLGG